MTGTIHAAAASIPGYCTGTVEPWSPHYATCVKAGWNEPTTTAVHVGHAATSGVGVFLVVLVIAVVVFAIAKLLGSRSPATQS
jgi:hypothetical protein